MFHRLNDKGDNSLTEIPGCPEKRIYTYVRRVTISNPKNQYQQSSAIVIFELQNPQCEYFDAFNLILIFGVLTPLSAIFQLHVYHGDQI
jgi:hypothetical protein